MSLKKIILLIVVSLVLGGCFSSQPTTFYLLRAMETSKGNQSSVPLNKINVLIRPIKVPEYLERPQMALRETDFKLRFSEYHRWAEPVKENFTQVLIENINTRIAPGNAMTYSELDGIKPDFQLAIEILRMDVSETDLAVLKVKWAVRTETNNSDIQRHSNEYSVPIMDRSFESGVEAQSEAIALFADQVAETLYLLNQRQLN